MFSSAPFRHGMKEGEAMRRHFNMHSAGENYLSHEPRGFTMQGNEISLFAQRPSHTDYHLYVDAVVSRHLISGFIP